MAPEPYYDSLPTGWRKVKLEEVLLPVTGTPEEHYTGRVTYVDISSVDAESRTISNPHSLALNDLPSRARRVVQTDDVLFATVRPYRRAIALVPELDQPVASTALCVLRASPEVDARFLYYLVQSDRFLSQLLPLQRGVSYPAVSDKDIRGIRVAIPPLGDQNEIVQDLDARLMQVKLGLVETEAALEKSHRLEQVLRDKIFDGEPGPGSSFDGEVTASGYPVIELGDVLISASYGTSKKCESDGDGEYVARIPNIVDGELSLAPAKYAIEPLSLDEVEYLQPNDILVVRTNGSLALVGRAALVDDAIPARSYFASYLIRLRCDEARVNPAWITEFLASSGGRAAIEAGAASTSGQKNIGLKVLRSLQLPLPPRNVQDEYLSQFSVQMERVREERLNISSALVGGKQGRQLLIELGISGQLAHAESALQGIVDGHDVDAPAVVAIDICVSTETEASDMNPEHVADDTSTVEDDYKEWRSGRSHSTPLVEEYYLELAKRIADDEIELIPMLDDEGRKVSDRLRHRGDGQR